MPFISAGLSILIAAFASTGASAMGFGLDLKGETEVAVGETITLSAEAWLANDVYEPGVPGGGLGEVEREVVNDKSQWSSSDEAIATVDSHGTVTGISEGTVTITVGYEMFDGINTNNLEITVKAPAQSEEPSEGPSQEPSDEPSQESSQTSVPDPSAEKPVRTGNDSSMIGAALSILLSSAVILAAALAKSKKHSR